MTFRDFFLKENSEEVTKITNPRGRYKVKYGDGKTETYTLDEDIFFPVSYALIDSYGFLHSPDNQTPAIEYTDKTDMTTSRGWYKHGLLHRDGDLPAELSIATFSHEKVREFFSKNGKRHRVTGPAVLSYYKGKIDNIDYYINNIRYTKEEFDACIKGLESKEDKELLGDLGQTFD